MIGTSKSSASKIPLDRAVGRVLAHDTTEIRPGEFKGPAFKRGHVIREEDLPHLRRLGKEHVFVLNMAEGEIHEEEAALRLAGAMAGPGVGFSENPSEGKIGLKASHSGLLKVDVETLVALNELPHMCCASRHNNTVVAQGETLAATRVIPLVIDEGSLERAVSLADARGGIFSVKEFSHPETGIIITGNEVYSGLIEDRFGPILKEKLAGFACPVKEMIYTPDEIPKISRGIRRLLETGVGLILVAGGMSVDPDDISPAAIAEAGGEELVYGTPVLPGAMLLWAHFDGVPVLGLPACVLFYRATVFDLVLPRVLAGERITRHDLAALGYGGYCLNCRHCTYPHCPFGKA